MTRTAFRNVLLAATATAALAICPSAWAAAPHKITKIGLMVQDMSNPFFSAMDRGAKRAAAAIGATVNTQDAQLDLANQNTQIDAFIQQKVDLIVVSAVEVQQADKANQIIVTGVDGSPEAVAELKQAGSPFIGTATQAPGKMVEQAIAIGQEIANGNPRRRRSTSSPACS